MNPHCLLRIAGACLLALIICGCETFPEGPFPRAAEVGWWNDEGASGPARIVVHIGEQKAYFTRANAWSASRPFPPANQGSLLRLLEAIQLSQRAQTTSQRYSVIT